MAPDGDTCLCQQGSLCPEAVVLGPRPASVSSGTAGLCCGERSGPRESGRRSPGLEGASPRWARVLQRGCAGVGCVFPGTPRREAQAVGASQRAACQDVEVAGAALWGFASKI